MKGENRFFDGIPNVVRKKPQRMKRKNLKQENVALATNEFFHYRVCRLKTCFFFFRRV